MYKPFFKVNTEEQQTERLFLRAFKMSDLDAYHEILGNVEVASWLGNDRAFSKEETSQWIAGMSFWRERHGYAPWAVVEKESGRLIGHCGLKFAEEFSAAELMFAIHPKFTNKGFATEAALFALHFGFGDLAFPKVIAFTQKQNIASCSVLRKIGMEYVGDVEYLNCPHVLFEKKR